MANEHKKYKYVFLFKKKGKFEELDLHGKSIKDFWNDIYDMFNLKGDIVVQKLNGQEFSVKEIKQLFGDLLENMMDDFSVIELDMHNLKTLEFINCYDGHSDIINKKIEEIGIDVLEDEAAFEEALEKEGLSGKDCEKLTKDLSYDNLKTALGRFNELKLEKIAIGFDIKPKLLKKKQFSTLRQALEYFGRAKDSKDGKFFNFYHIIDLVRKLGLYNRLLKEAGISKKTISSVTKLLNNEPIRGSRHEGKWSKLRNPTKDEINICEKTIKKLIESWIIESKMDNKND